MSSLPQTLLLANIYDTFLASVKSVGTAVTLAGVGVYLHRRGVVEGHGKRTLALLSQQVTFPLFLFTKIVYCNQDWSQEVSILVAAVVVELHGRCHEVSFHSDHDISF
jgi:predicted permease